MCVRADTIVEEIRLSPRYSFAYPGGLPAFGLLSMRMVLGLTASFQGVLCLERMTTARAGITVIGIVAILLGSSLVLGLQTRVCGLAMGVGIGILLASGFPPPPQNVFDTFLVGLLAEALCIGTLALGPGAFSLDCRLFGRKEIIIPYPSSDRR